MKKILLIAFMIPVFAVYAQQEYTFNAFNESYENLSNSISLNEGEVWDDPAYSISLGFDFYVAGETYNTIYFPADGLGGELSTFPSFEFGTGAILIPIGQDLVDLGETTGSSLSNISYKIEGSANNHILKIEWNNTGFYDDSFASDFINFQVWLYEGTNVIEFRYGPSQIDNPNESYEDEAGPIIAFAPLFDSDNGLFTENGYFLTGNPANPDVVLLTGDDEVEGSLVGNIPNGTIYRFSPQSLSTVEFSKIDFQIYPNPTSEFLNLKTVSNDYDFTIFNSLGQIMNTSVIKNKIDVSNLLNGIYFIKIETATGVATKKFIKN